MKLFASIFSGIGLVFLCFTLVLFNQEQHFLKEAKTASGKVIELGTSVSSRKNSTSSTTYYPIVTFTTAQGKQITFSSNFSSNPPSYEVGEEVEVYYLTDNPHNAEIKGFFSQWFAVLMCGGFGLIFSIIGFSTWSYMIKKKKLHKWLQENGKKLETCLQSVEHNTSLKINGKSPYIIYSQWLNPANNTVHVFKSENIMYNPENFIPGKTIQVRVDPNDYKKYLMDTSFLPSMR